MNQSLWKEQLIEEVKKEIAKEAREKVVELQKTDRLSRSLDSQEKLKQIKKLQELQRNYDYLQRELLIHTNSIKHPKSPVKYPILPPPLDSSYTIHSSLPSDKATLSQYKVNHLSQIQSLQNRAKLILEKERIANLHRLSEVPALTEKILKKKRQERVELSIPVYVPLSSIRKEKHLPPTVVNQILSSGEVMPVYMVGNPTPTYDPMVKIQQTIPNSNFNRQYRDSVDATAHSNQNASMDSVFYYKILKNSKNKNVNSGFTPEPNRDLTEAQLGRNLRPMTPTGLPHAWMFRELEYDSNKIEPKRKWVGERMSKYYEQRVKKDFLPKIDANKSLEIKLNKEKKKFYNRAFEKVKFL